MNAINSVRKTVRRWFRYVAKVLDRLSGGKILPNHVTLVSLLGHFLIAFFVAKGLLVAGAITLIIFGLLDTLDGELARLQGSSSAFGMVLDASSDRLKEGLLYGGLVYYLASINQIWPATLAILALVVSFSISYIKAKGESALATLESVPADKINSVFGTGFLRFEVRMTLIVLALLFNLLVWAFWIIIVLGSITAIYRLISVEKALNNL